MRPSSANRWVSMSMPSSQSWLLNRRPLMAAGSPARGCGGSLDDGLTVRLSHSPGPSPYMPESPRVALFVTCLVDLFRPSVGFAAVKLLEDAGCRVEVPRGQTCCGQPAFNSGRPRRRPSAIARGADRGASPATTTSWRRPAPAPACCSTHLPELFDDEPGRCASARGELAGRCHELVELPGRRAGRRRRSRPSSPARATYHDSCSGLRELGVKRQPRRLLAQRRGPGARRAGRERDLLRLRRHLLRQVPGDLDQDGRRQGRATIEATGADLRAGGRPRLPDEHRRPPEAAGLDGRGAPRRRGAGRRRSTAPPIGGGLSRTA